LVVLVGLVVTACGKPAGTSPSTAASPPPTATPEESPSYQVLAKGGYVYPAIPRITAEDLKRRLDNGEKMMLIDNRSEYKFKQGRLQGATNITYAIDSPFPGAESAMDAKLAALPNDTLKVLYCD